MSRCLIDHSQLCQDHFCFSPCEGRQLACVHPYLHAPRNLLAVLCAALPQDACAACFATAQDTASDPKGQEKSIDTVAMQQGCAHLDTPTRVLHPGDCEVHLCLVVRKRFLWGKCHSDLQRTQTATCSCSHGNAHSLVDRPAEQADVQIPLIVGLSSLERAARSLAPSAHSSCILIVHTVNSICSF